MRQFIFLISFFLLAAASFGQEPGLKSEEKDRVVDSLIRKLEANYISANVAQAGGQHLRNLQKTANYKSIGNPQQLAALLTDALRGVAHDKHLNLWYSKEKAAAVAMDPVKAATQEAAFMRQMQRVNLGFSKMELLDGNVGYLKIDGFGPVDKVGQTCTGAMLFLANTDALILDLRNNQGGEPEMVQYLASYFFDTVPVHLNDLYYRNKNKTDAYWTIPVPGARYLDKPVYLLTSGTTFSAGEELAYDLQTLKRGTVVGAITGGGANDGVAMDLGSGFFVYMPEGRAINPVTKTNWEGTGVQPDVPVPSETALTTAHKMALKAIIGKTPEKEKQFYTKALETIKE
ncbi:MAG: S41 family peptidase [Niabella sp.]|nr:S41 family peptidase [Niabella sp.]